MLHVTSSIFINAAPPVVKELYLDYHNWNRLFPLTIRSVKLIGMEGNVLTVEVDHRYEGFVIKILKILSSEGIKLEEFNPKYNAVFINHFLGLETGTLYSISAAIKLKGIYKLAAPFIRKLIRNKIMKFVLEPMKRCSELQAVHA